MLWSLGPLVVACLLLADISLSTESWLGDAGQVIQVIRDSLLLFAEALTACGDAFGLYGFSSIRREEVRYLLLKDFAERYDDACRGRILALRPGYYTRLGAAIRHSSRILLEQAAQRRVLLILSDGKPNDLDHYEGRYGVEDTRQAVLEARRAGLIPFCVTVDREAGDYLPHLFGAQGCVVVRDANELPRLRFNGAPVSSERSAFCSDSWKVRPMAMTSPTDFICVVRRASAFGNFSRRRLQKSWSSSTISSFVCGCTRFRSSMVMGPVPAPSGMPSTGMMPGRAWPSRPANWRCRRLWPSAESCVTVRDRRAFFSSPRARETSVTCAPAAASATAIAWPCLPEERLAI